MQLGERIAVLNCHVDHISCGRSLANLAKQLLQDRHRSLGDYFHIARSSVANPSGKLELLCRAHDEVAEAHSLHPPGDYRPELPHLHGLSLQPQSYSGHLCTFARYHCPQPAQYQQPE